MKEQHCQAADRLAAIMRQYTWYHRTSVVEEYPKNPEKSRIYLVVWGEGKRHSEVPEEFDGYIVRYNRVTKRNPCPFGSVKS